MGVGNLGVIDFTERIRQWSRHVVMRLTVSKIGLTVFVFQIVPADNWSFSLYSSIFFLSTVVLSGAPVCLGPKI